MSVRVPQEFQWEHFYRPRKWNAGGRPLGGTQWNYQPRCGCGWESPVKNLGGKEARALWRAHLEKEWAARAGGGDDE